MGRDGFWPYPVLDIEVYFFSFHVNCCYANWQVVWMGKQAEAMASACFLLFAERELKWARVTRCGGSGRIMMILSAADYDGRWAAGWGDEGYPGLGRKLERPFTHTGRILTLYSGGPWKIRAGLFSNNTYNTIKGNVLYINDGHILLKRNLA